MATKKELERKIKRLKKENKQLHRDYKSIGDDYAGYVLLYHDIIKLLVEFDSELLQRVVKTTLLADDKKGPYVASVQTWLNGEPLEIFTKEATSEQ